MSAANLLKNHRRSLMLGAIALAVLLTVGWIVRKKAGDTAYLTAKVQQGNIVASVEATGTINPLTTVPVGSYVSGTVKFIFADFNTQVRAGQVLAQLDPAIYEAQVTEARGNLANAQANVKNLEAQNTATQALIATNQANVAKLQAALEYARANANRTVDLFRQGIISADQNDLTQANMAQAQAQLQGGQAQVDQARAQLLQTKAQLLQAEAQVQTTSGALRQAETNLRYTTIISPIDGTIVARNVTVGQSVAASLQAPVVFTIAQDLKRMQVYAATDESDTGSIRIGTPVTFQVDAFPSQVFHGRVSAIRLNATTIQNVVTYNTIIDFENPEEKLLPGETAYVTIPTGHAAGVVKIPNAALRYSPSMPRAQIQSLYGRYHIPPSASTAHSTGTKVVWKLTPGGPVPVLVKTGVTDYNFTELRSGDLKAGDVLISGEETAGSGGRSQAFPGSPGYGRGSR
jgi:HlyD family secretion protein